MNLKDLDNTWREACPDEVNGLVSKRKKGTVKAVVFADDVINLTQEELKELFKRALENDSVNHFEIVTGSSAAE